MRHTSGRMIATSIAGAWLLLAAAAGAGGKDDARARFGEGVELYQAGKFAEAAEKFEAAYELKPTYKLLFNVGQARAANKEYDLALAAFEQYLVEGGDDLSDERRSEVLAEIAKIRPLVGYLDVEGPAGLVVEVDGRERGTTPLKSKLMVTVGHFHKVRVLRGDEVALEQEIKVFGGVVETLRVEEQAGVAPAPAAGGGEEPAEEPAPMDEDTSGMSTLDLWGWVTLGAGAAVAVAGGVVGGLAISQGKKLDEACPGGECAPTRQDEVDALGAMALTSDVLLGVGGAAAAAGLVMVLWPEDDGEDAGAEARVLPAPGGVVVDVRF